MFRIYYQKWDCQREEEGWGGWVEVAKRKGENEDMYNSVNNKNKVKNIEGRIVNSLYLFITSFFSQVFLNSLNSI